MLEGSSSPVFVKERSLCHFQASLSEVNGVEVSSTAWDSVVLKDFFTSDTNLLWKGLSADSSSVIKLSATKDTFLPDSFSAYLTVSVAVLPSLSRKDAGRSTLCLAEQQEPPVWGNTHQGRKGSELLSNTIFFSFSY